MGANRTLLVDVPGARLHTECSGSGPAVILIAGGGGDAGLFAVVVPLLARNYTVVTFDRRGNSRSGFIDAPSVIDVGTQAADVVSVLDAYGFADAYIFGNSSGAIIGLELIVRYPQRVKAAVVHEPPLVQLLTTNDPALQEIQRIGELGVDHPVRALVAFGVMTMSRRSRMMETRAWRAVGAVGVWSMRIVGSVISLITGRPHSFLVRILGNTDLLIRRELPHFCFAYRPDLDAVRATKIPWCLAVGRLSSGRPYYVATRFLAQEVGTVSYDFPGGHTPYQTHPVEFTARLREVFVELGS